MKAPWSISFWDGSNNGHHFRQDAPSAPVLYLYDPMTPLMSSSGTYSGGEPRRGTIDSDTADALIERVSKLALDTSAHTDLRMKGTGAFEQRSEALSRSFTIKRGEALRGFEAFLASLVYG